MASDDPRTDDTLVSATLASDPEAFGVLVGRHGAYVLGVARRFAQRDPAVDPEDVAQEVFARAYTRLASYVPAGRFPQWLGAIAAHYSIDRQRRRHFVVAVLDLLPARADHRPGPEDEALRADLAEALATALAALPPKQAAAVTLCYAQGYALREAAALLGVPFTTVNNRVWQGRQRLRALLAAV